MRIPPLLAVTALLSVTSFVCSAEIEISFPTDVKEFINDKEGCDHFAGEPRDFDESYKREFGKKAEVEEAERAAFLEEMTEKLCYQIDRRLTLLMRKYLGDKSVIDKLSQYNYLNIDTFTHIDIHQDFPNRELIQQKLLVKGFHEKMTLFENGSMPSKLTVQIGSQIDIGSAQRIIETFMEFGPKNIGIVVLPKNSLPIYATRIIVGDNPAGNNQVYVGENIKDLLSPDITQGDFEKFAILQNVKAPIIDCSKEMKVCKDFTWGCASLSIPEGAMCDKDCQANILEKLYAANVPVDANIGKSTTIKFSKEFRGCVGHNNYWGGASAILGGTEEGTKCIAKVLGYEYHATGCNGAGLPYDVRVH
ncbi:MAG: hypothetical protein PHQ60_04125 [Sideroxydans sp.]|nr:hypothetical protein [Sideroxydans sp.]